MSAHTLPTTNPWLWTQTWAETFAASLDPAGIGALQRDARLQRLLAAAFTESPFYRARRRGSSGGLPELGQLEPVDKAELMAHFDDWATDRRITRAAVEEFLADPQRLSDAFLGDYIVWTSSGTTGKPGVFVQDAQALAAYDALDAQRLHGGGSGRLPMASWGTGQRFAFVAATGGHFAGVASIERLRRIGAPWQWIAPAMRTFSVQLAPQELERELQQFAPTVLISYPSCVDELARAQAAGRIRLELTEAWVGGEQLGPQQRERIRSAFGCPVRNSYGSSEFYAMAWECPEARLHLNHDWLILEPVDRQMRAVPPGEFSDAVLLTNLANRTQPLLRYKLGDSVRLLGEPCACGSAFPAIEVRGRADHTLMLLDKQRREVRLLPLALSTVIEEGSGVTRFQLLGVSPQRLELRFESDQADPDHAFARARDALAAYLAGIGLGNVRIVHGREAPLRDPRSGKLNRVQTVRPG